MAGNLIFFRFFSYSTKNEVKTVSRITNHKLSSSIINKILKDKIEIYDSEGNAHFINNISNTGSEIDFLIYLSSIQDEFGKVNRVFYKDVVFALNISNPTYYSIIDRLVERQYIYAEPENGGYWNFTILNNIFLNNSDDKTPYLNTNKAFLHSQEFIGFPAKQKKIVLKLYLTYLKPNMDRYGLKFRLEKLCRVTGIYTKAELIRHLNAISAYFPYTLNDEAVKFSKGNLIFAEKFVESERSYSVVHNIKSFCHKYKIPYCITDIKDLLYVINQYLKKGLPIRKIYSIVFESLKVEKTVIAKLINTVLGFSLNPDKSLSPEERQDLKSFSFKKYINEKYSSDFLMWHLNDPHKTY